MHTMGPDNTLTVLERVRIWHDSLACGVGVCFCSLSPWQFTNCVLRALRYGWFDGQAFHGTIVELSRMCIMAIIKQQSFKQLSTSHDFY
jgi:hypothetical protein